MQVIHPRCCGLDVHKKLIVGMLPLNQLTSQNLLSQPIMLELRVWVRGSSSNPAITRTKFIAAALTAFAVQF